MDGNPLPTHLGNRFQIDPSGIVRAIAQQHHGPNRKTRRIGQNLLQTVADMRRRAGRGELFEAAFVVSVQPLQMIAQLIKPNLESLL